MNRIKIICQFDAHTVPKTGVSTLIINYELNSEEWDRLIKMALRVFAKENNFQIMEKEG